mmetsp:Transcript_110865/g.300887  ORF Transcript_110865/g.300887 Transcript_110865/m.300887 type:complete len:325 (+) Transcript_110865:1060-2034(+)
MAGGACTGIRRPWPVNNTCCDHLANRQRPSVRGGHGVCAGGAPRQPVKIQRSRADYCRISSRRRGRVYLHLIVLTRRVRRPSCISCTLQVPFSRSTAVTTACPPDGKVPTTSTSAPSSGKPEGNCAPCSSSSAGISPCARSEPVHGCGTPLEPRRPTAGPSRGAPPPCPSDEAVPLWLGARVEHSLQPPSRSSCRSAQAAFCPRAGATAVEHPPRAPGTCSRLWPRSAPDASALAGRRPARSGLARMAACWSEALGALVSPWSTMEEAKPLEDTPRPLDPQRVRRRRRRCTLVVGGGNSARAPPCSTIGLQSSSMLSCMSGLLR